MSLKWVLLIHGVIIYFLTRDHSMSAIVLWAFVVSLFTHGKNEVYLYSGLIVALITRMCFVRQYNHEMLWNGSVICFYSLLNIFYLMYTLLPPPNHREYRLVLDRIPIQIYLFQNEDDLYPIDLLNYFDNSAAVIPAELFKKSLLEKIRVNYNLVPKEIIFVEKTCFIYLRPNDCL